MARASLLGLLALLAVAACGDGRPAAHDRGPASGGPTIGVVLEGAARPRLRARLAFHEPVAPDAHVQPLAAALAGVRAPCLATLVRAGGATAELRLSRGAIAATGRGPAGACLAAALDGAAIADPGELTLRLDVEAAP